MDRNGPIHSLLKRYLLLVVTGCILGLTLITMLVSPGAQRDAQESTYPQIARTEKLQHVIQALEIDQSWREAAGIRQPSETVSRPGFWQNLIFIVIYGLNWLLRALIVIIPVMLIAIIAFIFYRYRSGFRTRVAQDIDSGERKAKAKAFENVDIPDQPTRFEDILSIPDSMEALTLLQNAVLKTSSQLTHVVMRREDTARQVALRLPPGWEHRDRVRQFVLKAERIRFAGDPLARNDLETMASQVRPILEGQSST